MKYDDLHERLTLYGWRLVAEEQTKAVYEQTAHGSRDVTLRLSVYRDARRKLKKRPCGAIEMLSADGAADDVCLLGNEQDLFKFVALPHVTQKIQREHASSAEGSDGR